MSILMLLMIYEMLHVISLQILTNYYTLSVGKNSVGHDSLCF